MQGRKCHRLGLMFDADHNQNCSVHPLFTKPGRTGVVNNWQTRTWRERRRIEIAYWKSLNIWFMLQLATMFTNLRSLVGFQNKCSLLGIFCISYKVVIDNTEFTFVFYCCQLLVARWDTKPAILLYRSQFLRSSTYYHHAVFHSGFGLYEIYLDKLDDWSFQKCFIYWFIYYLIWSYILSLLPKAYSC